MASADWRVDGNSNCFRLLKLSSILCNHSFDFRKIEMDRFESMTVFVAVARAGSFSGASRELHMPLPTVSRKVSELETHLDAKLLVRSTRKLALTEVGESYLLACRHILEQVAEAERGATGEYHAPHGDLLVTAPVVLGRLHVVPVATAFLQAHPDVDMQLLLTDRPLNLVDEHLDLAVRIGDLPDSTLLATRVGQTRTVICASPEYLKARGAPMSPAALTNHDCITLTALGGADEWSFRNGERVRVHSRLVVNTAEAAVDAALRGTGLARVLCYQVAALVRERKLAIVLDRFGQPPSPVSLIYVRERRLTGKLRAFLDFATPRLRSRLAEAAA